jgi:acetyl/propionyl-CoA carboxylase alpha subunit
VIACPALCVSLWWCRVLLCCFLPPQLDTYVIHGVGHNVHFLRSVLTNPRFVSGNMSTAFIPEEFPEGFHGVKLTPVLKNKMVAIGAAMAAQWEFTRSTITGQAGTAQSPITDHFVVTIAGEVFDVKVVDSEDGSDFAVDIKSLAAADAKTERLSLSDVFWTVEEPLFLATLNGSEPLRGQHLERLPEGFKVQLEGAVADVVRAQQGLRSCDGGVHVSWSVWGYDVLSDCPNATSARVGEAHDCEATR